MRARPGLPAATVLVALVCGAAARADPVAWSPSWQRVRTWEYVAGPALVAEGLVLRFVGPQPDTTWRGGILFDDAFIDSFAVRSESRAWLAAMGDVGFYNGFVFRLLDS